MKDIKIIHPEKYIFIEDVINFEKVNNIIFPFDYKEFLLKHNGGHPIPDCYNLMDKGSTNSSDLAWFYSLLYGKDENLEKNIYFFKDRIPKNLMAIACDSGGNQVCLCIKGPNYGKVYYWDHNWEAEEGQEPTYENVYLIANSFTDFINSLYEYKLPE